VGRSPLVTCNMLALIAMVAVVQDRPNPDWLPVLDAPKNLTYRLALPKPAFPGQPIILKGKVLKADRKSPVPGMILYFHHTDARGHYPRPSNAGPRSWSYWHGTLRGWLKTDSMGRYVLSTTRPAAYPGRTDPAHIHVYGLPPNSREGIYFSDFVFRGDPLLTAAYWRTVTSQGGESYGGVQLVRDQNGVWRGDRDLIMPK